MLLFRCRPNKKPPETVLCFNVLGGVDEGGEEDESIQTIDIPHKYGDESLTARYRVSRLGVWK